MRTHKLKGMLSLFRPELSLAAGICVFTGQVLAAGGLPDWRAGLLGFACAFFLSAAALILNDVFDYEVDRINAPQRALPSGAVSRSEAVGLTAFVSLAGLAAALLLGPDVFLLSILFWLIGIYYKWRGKESGLPGNLMVSASVAVTFLLGAQTVGQLWNGLVWIFSGMAFFIDFGEEIAGDAMDMEGDRQRGSRSLALLYGRQKALRLAVGLWGVVIALSFLPVLLGLMRPVFLVFLLVMDALIIYFSLRLLRSTTPAEGRMAMRGVYLGATLCVLVFVIAQVAG